MPRDLGPPSVHDTARQRCLLCGSERFDNLFIPKRRITMSRCLQCGLWVNQATLGEDAAVEHYGPDYHEGYYRKNEARKARTAVCLVRNLEALHPAKGRLLDLGCSLGHMVQAAKNRGWDAWGVDLNEAVVASGRDRGLQMAVGSLRSLPFPDGHFEVVHARHVLEHDLEVWESLAEIGRVQSPGGLLALTVPDGGCLKVRRRGARYAKFWKPDHMLCFTRPTLVRLLQHAGYTPLNLGLMQGLAGEGLCAALRLLGWRLSVAVPEQLGLGNTITSFWRQSAEAHWPA